MDKQGEPVFIIGKISDVDEKKREELRLQEKAMKDAMTGLFNRAAIKENEVKGYIFIIKIMKLTGYK